VRRALVARLLELMAAGSDWAVIDRRAERLSRIYAVRAGGGWPGRSADPDSVAPPAPATRTPEREAESLRAIWERTARAAFPSPTAPVALDRILRAHSARLVQADGPIQRFHAHQVVIAELMAFVVGAEQASAAPECAVVLDRFAGERAEATDVVEQVLAGERAMLSLWMIRLLGPEQGGRL